jgi:hypothetical protein
MRSTSCRFSIDCLYANMFTKTIRIHWKPEFHSATFGTTTCAMSPCFLPLLYFLPSHKTWDSAHLSRQFQWKTHYSDYEYISYLLNSACINIISELTSIDTQPLVAFGTPGATPLKGGSFGVPYRFCLFASAGRCWHHVTVQTCTTN